jgi:hypothetical protein
MALRLSPQALQQNGVLPTSPDHHLPIFAGSPWRERDVARRMKEREREREREREKFIDNQIDD